MTDFGKKTGDMLKSVYDADEDGTVDDSSRLQGKSKDEVQDHAPKSHNHAESEITDLVDDLAGKSATGHTHTESEITDLDHDALKIKGVEVNDAAIGDQKILAYDLATEKVIYIDQPAG